jgi:HEPN domain-containing protein
MAESSHSSERIEVAELLTRRAAGDLKAARKLSPDPEIDEGIIGFHAQQAVEKALKATLTLEGVDFPKTHDIDFLVGLAGEHPIEMPDEISAAGWLTPWAAEFRYDDEPLDSLDRNLALEVAGNAVAWCEGLLDDARAEAQDEDGEEDSGRP